MQNPLNHMEEYLALFGRNDQNIRVLEDMLGVSVQVRGQEIQIKGEKEAVETAEKVLHRLAGLIQDGDTATPEKVRYLIDLHLDGLESEMDSLLSDEVAVTGRGKKIRCRTVGQLRYVNSIRRNTVTLALGPAGTGKTYLAVAMAVSALRKKECDRIVLTRPAVEAGERLGFLPGDMAQKVDPYLRPLYDALYEMVGTDNYQHLMERGILEIAPLAFMRGRTLAHAFIILDEAQNTTSEQMKMFLTRLGEGSRCVVTGDESQTDLPKGKQSGLTEAADILSGIPDIGIVRLSARDVVRHELVQKIVTAYARKEKKEERHENEEPTA